MSRAVTAHYHQSKLREKLESRAAFTACSCFNLLLMLLKSSVRKHYTGLVRSSISKPAVYHSVFFFVLMCTPQHGVQSQPQKDSTLNDSWRSPDPAAVISVLMLVTCSCLGAVDQATAHGSTAKKECWRPLYRSAGREA